MTSPAISPLVADLITRNADDLANTTNYLLDRLTAERDEARATLGAIRIGMNHLLNQPWVPSENAIAQVIYSPDPALIASEMGRLAADRDRFGGKP